LAITAEVLTAFGIQPEYFDIWGNKHATRDDVAEAILRSLGVQNIDGAVQQQLAETWRRPLDPTLVIREDTAIPLRIPAEHAGRSVQIEIQWESGELEHHSFHLPELPELERTNLDGRDFVSKRVTLPNPRLGYHRLRAFWMDQPGSELLVEARLIVCPKRANAPEGRIAGVALSLYGLRSQRNWGCGDFTDLRAAIDALAPAGVQFIALNPLHAIPNRQPFNTSPYLPLCSLYRNFLYLDVERCGAAQTDAREIEALRASEFVEYERVAALKLTALRTIFDHFTGSPEFDQYIQQEGSLLHDFAVFCALDAEIHRTHPDVWLWRDWPPEYRDPRSDAVARFAQEHARDVLFYKFLQWHIDLQLADVQAHARERGMRVGLYHDMALATDRWGADLWANGRFYAAGCRVGAPPDDFSPNGQDWAFPPPNRTAHRADGYQLFAELIRKTARHGGALRIDHVMRFFRLWWIPDNKPATDGAYVLDYANDLMGILALESVRAGFIVIGEDLGTVTDEVRASLTQHGILSYRVLWFERHPDGSFKKPEEYPAQAAATTSTHDLPTLAGFFQSRDIEARKAAGLADEAGYQQQLEDRRREIERLHDALKSAGFENDPIGFLLSTPCELAIINQEDLTGETEQQNLPGSTWQHPNWRRKMKVAVEDFQPIAARLRRAIEQSGRT
jgi:4-alpha-glucanotransferase